MTRHAEEFAARPYAVNIFPIDTKKNEKVYVSVGGEVICPVIKKSEIGELLFRLYNPKNEPSEFTVTVGNNSITDVAAPRAIVTVGYTDGGFTVYKDSTPV